MSNNKQTAVEWLWEQITSGSVPKSNLLHQAKAMEKEQHKETFMAFESNTEENEEMFEEYYTETYGE